MLPTTSTSTDGYSLGRRSPQTPRERDELAQQGDLPDGQIGRGKPILTELRQPPEADREPILEVPPDEGVPPNMGKKPDEGFNWHDQFHSRYRKGAD